MAVILQVFYAFFSSLLQTTAIPNEIFLRGFPLVSLICLAPLYISANKSRSYTMTFFCFAIQTGILHIFSSFWLGFYRDFAIFTLGASAAGTAIIGGFFGIFFHAGSKLFDSAHQKNSEALRIIFFATIWTSWEWLKCNFGFLAYPWGTLSMTAFSWTNLIQIADITGAYGISFLFAFFSAIVGEILQKQKITKSTKNAIKAFFVLFSLAMLYGRIQITKERTIEKELSAVIVQQNIDPWISKDDRIGIRRSQALTDTTLKELEELGKKPDIIVWSEGVLNHALPNAQIYYENVPEENPLFPYIRKTAIPFIIGGALTVTPKNVRPRRHSNVAFLFGADGEIKNFHAKNHLVPFGEYIPFSENANVARFLKSQLRISAGWLPGNKVQLFSLPIKNDSDTVTFSIPICFEDAFPDLHRKMFFDGSELFINITNDSWSMTKSAEWQHLAVAAFRSVEFRQTMVRATNSGCSAVILPTGKIKELLPLFEEKAECVTLPIFSREKTAYAVFGDVFAFLAILFSAFIIFKSRKCAIKSYL